MITENILSLINSETFQGLKSYYDETTLFNVIGAERSENRHSAFLRWFFSPDSCHGLGDKPLRLFLRLLATLKWGRQTFKEELYNKVIAGNYELDLLEPVETEKYVGKIKANTKNSKDRIDLWMVVGLTYEIDGEQKTHAFPIVIENKIYAKEGELRYFLVPGENEMDMKGDLGPREFAVNWKDFLEDVKISEDCSDMELTILSNALKIQNIAIDPRREFIYAAEQGHITIDSNK